MGLFFTLKMFSFDTKRFTWFLPSVVCFVLFSPFKIQLTEPIILYFLSSHPLSLPSTLLSDPSLTEGGSVSQGYQYYWIQWALLVLKNSTKLITFLEHRLCFSFYKSTLSSCLASTIFQHVSILISKVYIFKIIG